MHGSGQRNTGHQVHQSSAGFLGHKAGEHFIHCIAGMAANSAVQLLAVPIKHIGMLIVFTDRHRALGILIQYRAGAARVNIVCCNSDLVLICGDIHIYAFKI